MTPTVEQASSSLFTFITAIKTVGPSRERADVINQAWKNSPGTRREEWEELFDAEFPVEVV